MKFRTWETRVFKMPCFETPRIQTGTRVTIASGLKFAKQGQIHKQTGIDQSKVVIPKLILPPTRLPLRDLLPACSPIPSESPEEKKNKYKTVSILD